MSMTTVDAYGFHGDDTVESNSVVEDDDWQMYGDRDDWRDVQPVPQIEAEAAVVRIAYSPRFVDVYDRVRAVMQSGEASRRVLRLLSAAIELNPANYTVWQTRRDVLMKLSAPLQPELAFTRSLIEDSPKNYQVWHHRRWVVQRLACCDGELRFTELALSRDAKNFHVWQYRQWLISEFDLFDGEIDFVERLIDEDVFNNSAWNQRFFVLTRSSGSAGLDDGSVVNKEVDFCRQQLTRAPDNESVWNYARGVLLHSSSGLLGCHQLLQLAREQLEEKRDTASRHAVSFLVDALLECTSSATAGNSLAEALDLMQLLADKLDPIRRRYWLFQMQMVRAKHDRSSRAEAITGGN